MIDLLLPQRRRTAEISYRTHFLEGRDLVELLGLPTSSKINVTEDVALTYSAVWAATRLLSGTGGWLPLNLYRRVSERENRIASNDSRDDLVFRRPNTEMDSMPFRSMGFSYQINSGNAYAEIERDNGGKAINLWPIHPFNVHRVRDQDGDIYYRVNNSTGEPSFIPARDMLHVPNVMTSNGIDGRGIIQSARESIGMGLATERHGASHFGSGGIPQIVILHKQKFPEPGRSTFRKEWHEIHGGQGETAKSNVAILDAGADLKTIGLSPEDSQFLGTREHNINEIARWYGVPPHMIGDLRRATFTNIEAQGIEFVVFSLIQLLKLWEQQLSSKLLTEAERQTMFFEFNVNALLRGDAAARAAYYTAMVNNGMMSRNEARRLENFPPYEGGDEFFLQGAMVPVKSLLATADKAVDATSNVTVTEAPVNPEDVAANDVQAAALNGAQIASLIEIGNLLVTDQLPPGGTKAMLEAAFPAMDKKLIETIVSELDKFEPEPPEPQEPVAPPVGAAPIDEPTADKPEPVDEQAANETLRRCTLAARAMLLGSVARMIHKEATAARRAANKPGEFLKWLDAFYDDKHLATYTEAIQPACDALQALGFTFTAEEFPVEQSKVSYNELLEASGTCSAADLPNKIEECVSRWERVRPVAIVDSIIPLTAA